MSWFKEILIFIGLKKRWIKIKCKELKLVTDISWGGVYSVRYKLIQGSYIKKSYSTGSPDDNGYIGYNIFKPKTQQAKILIWIDYYTKNKHKIKRYLVILNQNYKLKREILQEHTILKAPESKKYYK
jgi:hypothetical protein